MKMASQLPPDIKKNGMGQVAKLMLDYPDRPIVAIVVLDCAQTLTDNRKQTRVPTIGVLHIEPMVDPYDHAGAHRLLQRAYLARTSEQIELELDFNVPEGTISRPNPPVSRWRPIDNQGNIAADALPEPPDDPEPEVDKDDETGPPEVDMDAQPASEED